MATLGKAKRIVVKIGSALLVNKKTGALRQEWLASLAEDVAELRSTGTDVVIVSSGSIALGVSVLGLGAAKINLRSKPSCCCGRPNPIGSSI